MSSMSSGNGLTNSSDESPSSEAQRFVMRQENQISHGRRLSVASTGANESFPALVSCF